MSLFSVTLIDSSGNAQTGKDVDLYEGDGTGAKTGDFTDNGDGTYYIDVATSGEYTVKVGGVTQTEMQSIYISADDQLKTGDVDGTTIEVSGGSLQVKDGGISAAKLATDAVETAKIKDANVTTAKIADANVTTAKIADAAVTAAKIDSGVMGSRAYTIKHVVNDGEPLDTSIDALDSAVGNLDFSDDDLLKHYMELAQNHLPWYNLTNALKVLSRQIMSNLKAITNGTEVFNRRVIFNSLPVAGSAAGDTPAADTEWIETSNNYVMKIRGSFYPRVGDKFIKIYFQGKVSGDDGIICYNDLVNYNEKVIESGITSYQDNSITIDISDISQYPIGEKHFFGIYMKIDGTGTGTVYMRNPEITIEGAS